MTFDAPERRRRIFEVGRTGTEEDEDERERDGLDSLRWKAAASFLYIPHP